MTTGESLLEGEDETELDLLRLLLIALLKILSDGLDVAGTAGMPATRGADEKLLRAGDEKLLWMLDRVGWMERLVLEGDTMARTGRVLPCCTLMLVIGRAAQCAIWVDHADLGREGSTNNARTAG